MRTKPNLYNLESAFWESMTDDRTRQMKRGGRAIENHQKYHQSWRISNVTLRIVNTAIYVASGCPPPEQAVVAS
jgi:hypothetical protein